MGQHLLLGRAHNRQNDTANSVNAVILTGLTGVNGPVVLLLDPVKKMRVDIFEIKLIECLDLANEYGLRCHYRW